ncbi:Sar1, ras family GTPase [Apodospora peruviana]|uniref:Sar1, ras family GTPase n=1 Tax=Apodospora peruviana TaxID=516989 RepID=A0AAE0I5X9_9PEZI|nr:Sar1, ras family GTPase [Apodospora peruviana]
MSSPAPLGPKPKKVVVVGLDNAGKSKLLRQVWNDLGATLPRTISPSETSSTSLAEAAGIVFVVDATDDHPRWAEAKRELHGMLAAFPPGELPPIVILGTKIDRPYAVEEAVLIHQLGLAELVGGRPITMFMCSVDWKFGYKEAFKWLSENL